jgi:hypothetical protein
MKIYNSKKCYCCFQKFENNNHFYEYILIQKNLNYDCITNIISYLTPKKYQLNILNKFTKYYCKKCISIILYQFNKHGQFSSYYKHKFLSLRKQRSYEEDCFNYDTMNEINDLIYYNWKFERTINYNYNIPCKLSDLIYFNKFFVANLGSRWSKNRKDEIEYAFKWIKDKKIPLIINIY